MAAGPLAGVRVLVVDNFVPDPTIGGGVPRAAALLAALVDLGCHVRLLPTVARATTATAPRGVAVIAATDRGARANVIDRALREDDVVIISRAHNLRATRAALNLDRRARVIFDCEAIGTLRDRERATLFGDSVALDAAGRALTDDLAMMAAADAILAVSRPEMALIAAHVDRPVHHVGHGLPPVADPPPFAARRGIIFVGPVHDDGSPNADALRWFGEAAWPILRSRDPTLVWTVIGRLTTTMTAWLADRGARPMGPAEDLAPHYAAARVAIAPTRFAAGIPVKVLEAAAHGVPVVATSLLGRQLGWRDGEQALLVPADDPAHFADACRRLSMDGPLWSRVSVGARAWVATHCDPMAFRDAVATALSLTLAQRPR